MGGCATPGRHSTRCRSCRLPRALMLNGFAVQEFRLLNNSEADAPNFRSMTPLRITPHHAASRRVVTSAKVAAKAASRTSTNAVCQR